jgi:hypothetical protein
MKFDWEQLKPTANLTEVQRSLVLEIASNFLTTGAGIEEHKKKVALSKDRRLLSDLSQMGFIRNVASKLYPTFPSLYYVHPSQRDPCLEAIDLVFRALKAMYERGEPQPIAIGRIEQAAAGRPAKATEAIALQKALLFVHDFSSVFGVQQSDPNNPTISVTVTENILDYEDLQQAWRKELITRPSPQPLPVASAPLREPKDASGLNFAQLKTDLGNVTVSRSSPAPEDEGISTIGGEQATIEDQDVVPLIRLQDFSVSATTRKVLDHAIQLATKRIPSPQPVTSSTLLFAMVETGRELRTFVAPRFLQSWISDKDEQAYLTAYEGYVAEGGLAYYERSNIMSANALAILQRATEIAKATSRSHEVHSRHLLGSLLVYRPGLKRRLRARERLAGMGFDLPLLRQDFLRYVESARKDDHAAWDRILSVEDDAPAPIEPSLGGQHGPSTHVARDRWTTEDSLGHFPYAYAIYRFLTDAKTQPPLAISIQAPWGGGKSSLMRMIQSQLDPDAVKRLEQTLSRDHTGPQSATVKDVLSELERGNTENRAKNTGRHSAIQDGKTRFAVPVIEGGARRRVTIWFNAWKYDSTSQVWAGLADCIVQQIGERLGPVERELFWFRLQLRRLDASTIRRKVYDEVFSRFFAKVMPWSFIYLGSAAASIVGAIILQTANHPLYGWSSFLVAICTEFLVAKKQFGNAKSEVEEQPARMSLGEVVQAPDYRANLGFVHEVVEDLKKVFEIIPTKHLPMIVFIDDLDRCSPGKVADVVEAINLFLAGEFPHCMFILGIDDEMVAAALDKAHGDVIAKLPGYAKSTSLGWRFMDKFVQLPFIIPPSTASELNGYTESLLSQDGDRTDIDIETRDLAAQVVERGNNESAPAENVVEQVAVREPLTINQRATLKKDVEVIQEMSRNISQFSDQEKSIRELIVSGARDFSTNPRDLKRFVNLFRFYYFLRAAREGRKEQVPSLEQMCRWIILSLRWPEVVRWLRHPSRQNKTSRSPLAALENLGATSKDIVGWQQRAEAELGLKPAEASWLSDEGLLKFFQKEASSHNEQERLSACAGMGLW